MWRLQGAKRLRSGFIVCGCNAMQNDVPEEIVVADKATGTVIKRSDCFELDNFERSELQVLKISIRACCCCSR
jgi:hypothetical protein